MHAQQQKLTSARLNATIRGRSNVACVGTAVGCECLPQRCDIPYADARRQLAFGRGDGFADRFEQSSSRSRESHDFGALVRWIRVEPHESHCSELLDHLTHRLLGHARANGDISNLCSIKIDVPRHGEMRDSDIGVALAIDQRKYSFLEAPCRIEKEAAGVVVSPYHIWHFVVS